MEKWRQLLHIEPPDGWLNDPNGLSYYNGEYHIYFQYSPGSAEGATPRCWGHYHGDNLLHLKYDRIVLSPDIPEDRNGVYSGSGIVHDDVLYLFYTGNVKKDGEYDYINSGREANVILVTSEDGSAMSEKQVLLKNSDYPDFCSCHVRDPKVWLEDNIWKMVLGARTRDDKGCVLLYHSTDLKNWEYKTALSIPNFGYMWECPDCFVINGKRFLSVSPQGLPTFETKYQNIYQSGYFSVDGSLENGVFGSFYEWDMGFDFYAPQTFASSDGRRIIIGWMGMGDIPYGNATTLMGWQHCLTLPREITVSDNGRIIQNPIRELEHLRSESVPISEKPIIVPLPFELCGKTADNFEIVFDNSLILSYSNSKKLFTLQFTNKEYGCGRTVRKAEIHDCHTIRIIADMSSLEIYLNNGETVISTRFFPYSNKVCLEAHGVEGIIWNLEA